MRLKMEWVFEKAVTAFLLLCPIIGALILFMPFYPEINYQLTSREPIEPAYNIVYAADKLPDNDTTTAITTYETDGNRVVIPKIGVDTKILEWRNEDIMLWEEGAWRDPETAIPGKTGNMVVGGHRFQYLPPNTTTFYNLDKLRTGDHIEIYWEGLKYTYEVYNSFEVMPDGIWIKSQDTDQQELTLYTCTPVFSSARRLVIKARAI